MTWIRGRRSYIFRGDDSYAELMEVNHDDEVVDTERFNISQEMEDVTLESMQPAEQEVAKRNKSGIWGWRTDKTEVVNGFEAKVFSVNNVNVVIRTRTEHLTDEEKARIKSERNILESLLGTVEQHISAQGDLTLEYATATNPTAITPEEYFDPDFDLGNRDIGRPIELSIRTQKFKGTLWMSEEHPLSLVEQVTPIIDLMARTSSHFARLRDFVALKFPPGFPVKIEIPLFHVLNAKITFGNVNKCSTAEEANTTPAATPTSSGEDEEAAALPPFQVCPSVFVVPGSYHRRGGSRHTPMSNNDEELLQYAIHQSLLESRRAPGQEGSWDDGEGEFSDVIPSSQSDRSIPEGVLVEYGDTSSPASSISASSPDSDLRLAMELSARAQEEEERMRKQEEEELERILQLSLTENEASGQVGAELSPQPGPVRRSCRYRVCVELLGALVAGSHCATTGPRHRGLTFENGTDVFPYGYGTSSVELSQRQLHVKERHTTKDGHENIGNKESTCTEMFTFRLCDDRHRNSVVGGVAGFGEPWWVRLPAMTAESCRGIGL
ncbi:hypothetical protein INR49_006214 [Caranx melampygus]|nr:hypothetical protein INR49_006214 [Caranx melampygus]